MTMTSREVDSVQVIALFLLLALLQGRESGAYERSSSFASGRWDSTRIAALVDVMPKLMDRQAVPGVAISLVANESIQWASGFGVVAVDGSQVTPSTVFQAASLGKPVFAQVVATVEQQEEWRFDDPLSAVVPRAGLGEQFVDLTVEQLLSHCAGVKYDPVGDRIVSDPTSVGTWQYSGSGYALLQRALERSFDESLTGLAERLVFQPASMPRSHFVTRDSEALATGHDREGRPLAATSWTEPNAASSLYTTADDYARFLVYFLSGLEMPTRENLSLKPVVTVDEDLGLYWGRGWALEIQPGQGPVAFHWGSNPGFKSFALASPQRGLGIVVLTNGDNGLELVEEVMEILDPVPHALFRFYMLHPDD